MKQSFSNLEDRRQNILKSFDTQSDFSEFDLIVSSLFNIQNILEHCHRKTKNEPKHEALGEAYTQLIPLKDSIIEQITGLTGTQYNNIQLWPISGYTPEMCDRAAEMLCELGSQIQKYSQKMQYISIDNLAQDVYGVGAQLKYKLSLNQPADESSMEMVKGIVDEFQKGLIDEDTYIERLGMIEKGKRGMIGEVREWNGKKYKKQSNGKWIEVSDKEHSDEEVGLNKKDSSDQPSKQEILAGKIMKIKDPELKKVARKRLNSGSDMEKLEQFIDSILKKQKD